MPLYFAEPRPVVERDGTLIMVDDDRMPLADGEVPAAAQRPVPHAGLLPADRRGRERRPRTLPEIIQEMLLTTTSERQGRVIDHDSAGVDGEEEAGGVLLMAARHRDELDRRRTSRTTSTRHEHKSLLRFITCGSVDDGKSTLIGRLLYESKLVFDDQLAALEADSKQVRHPGRRAGLRAAGRRPGRRARAGHHHRRRLPVLLHRATASSSSPTPRATSSTPATWSPAPRPPTSR